MSYFPPAFLALALLCSCTSASGIAEGEGEGNDGEGEGNDGEGEGNDGEGEGNDGEGEGNDGEGEGNDGEGEGDDGEGEGNNGEGEGEGGTPSFFVVDAPISITEASPYGEIVSAVPDGSGTPLVFIDNPPTANTYVVINLAVSPALVNGLVLAPCVIGPVTELSSGAFSTTCTPPIDTDPTPTDPPQIDPNDVITIDTDEPTGNCNPPAVLGSGAYDIVSDDDCVLNPADAPFVLQPAAGVTLTGVSAVSPIHTSFRFRGQNDTSKPDEAVVDAAYVQSSAMQIVAELDASVQDERTIAVIPAGTVTIPVGTLTFTITYSLTIMVAYEGELNAGTVMGFASSAAVATEMEMENSAGESSSVQGEPAVNQAQVSPPQISEASALSYFSVTGKTKLTATLSVSGSAGIADITYQTIVADTVTLEVNPLLLPSSDWWTISHQPSVEMGLSAHLLLRVPVMDFLPIRFPARQLARAGNERDGNSSAYPPLSGDGLRFSKSIDLGNDTLIDAAARPGGGVFLLTNNLLSRQLVTINGVGELVDTRSLGLVTAQRIVPRSDGGLYVVGVFLGDVFVSRLDASYAPLWTQGVGLRAAGALADDAPLSTVAAVVNDGSNDLVVAGSVSRGGVARTFVLRLDEDGNVVWAQDHDTTSLQTYNKVLSMSDGSIMVAGNTQLDPDPLLTSAINSTYLLRLEGNGSVRWARSWGTSDNTNVKGMAELSTGGVVCAVDVSKPINETGPPGALLAVDDDGNFLWSQSFAGTPSNARPVFNVPSDITSSGDGVVVVGEMQTGLQTAKIAWIARFVDNVSRGGRVRPMAPTWWAQHDGAGQETFLRVFDSGDALFVVGTTTSDGLDANLWVSTVPYEGVMPYSAAGISSRYNQRYQSSGHQLRLDSLPVFEATRTITPTAVPLTTTAVDVNGGFTAGVATVSELAR